MKWEKQKPKTPRTTLKIKKLIRDVDTMVFILPYFCTKTAAYKHTCAHTSTKRHTNKNIGQCSTSTNSRKCRGANKLTNYYGIGHIVYLLKKKLPRIIGIAKTVSALGGWICDQIFIFRHDIFLSKIVYRKFYRKLRNSCNIQTASLRYAIHRCCIKKLNCYSIGIYPI